MIGHGCGYFVYPQLYDRIDRIFKRIPCSYSNCYVVPQGITYWKKNSWLKLSQSRDFFYGNLLMIWVKWNNCNIREYTYIYGQRRIPKKCRTGNICFTSVVVIGDILFRSIRNNPNHVHKYERYLLSVITTLGTNVIGRDTFFMMVSKFIIWDWEVMFWIIYM